MQLDNTSVVIAQRTGTELVDLSLMVVRRYFIPIATLAFLGAAPFAILNAILMWPLIQYDSLAISSSLYGDPTFFRVRYYTIGIVSVFVQAPLALSGVTYFIGQAVFGEKPTLRLVASAIKNRLLALIYVQGLFALLFVHPEFYLGVEAWSIVFAFYLFFIRGFVPFALEILLLERCPLFHWGKKKSTLGFGKRSSWLHSGLYFELFGGHIGVSLIELTTIMSLSGSVYLLVGVVVGVWDVGSWMDLFLFPLAVWTVATWGTVIRFLSYMNTRILTEGWEIELKLKAESQRLTEAALG
jgi:hypothetical protein